MTEPPATAARRPLAAVDRLAIVLSTVMGIGYAPKAPGTFGSIPGALLGLALAAYLPPAGRIGALLVLIGLSLWAIHRMETALGIHDDQRIVIDEVCGAALAVAFLQPTWMALLAGFALFRLFDIWKPLLIGRIDRDAPGAFGTLGDDLLAGIVAGAILWPFLA